MINLQGGGVGFEARWEDLFSKEDEFNLVWVPLLEDVGPLDLKFQILKKKKKKDLHHWRSIVNNYYDLEYVYYEGFMYNSDDLTIKPINQTCDFNLFWFLQLFSKPV